MLCWLKWAVPNGQGAGRRLEDKDRLESGVGGGACTTQTVKLALYNCNSLLYLFMMRQCSYSIYKLYFHPNLANIKKYKTFNSMLCNVICIKWMVKIRKKMK